MGRVKVMSLNIWEGGMLLPAVLQFLKKEQPDILLCQEVYNAADPTREARLRTFTVLGQELGYPAADFAPAYFDTHEGAEEGNAIFSRFPIVDRSATFYAEPYRELDGKDPQQFHSKPHVIQLVALDTPSGLLDVFNVHGPWDLDGDNYGERRQKMAKAVVKMIKGKKKVVLGGDTNARPTNQAIRDIEQHVVNVFGHELANTFNMRRKDNPGYATSVVDMLFVTPNIRVLSKQRHDVDVSDHVPISAVLEI